MESLQILRTILGKDAHFIGTRHFGFTDDVKKKKKKSNNVILITS